MGERYLALRILRIVTRNTAAGSVRADAILSWCDNNGTFLDLPDPKPHAAEQPAPSGRWSWRRAPEPKQPDAWEQLGRSLGQCPDTAPAKPDALLDIVGRLANLVDLGDTETRLLQAIVASHRLRFIYSLCDVLKDNGVHIAGLLAELAGLSGAEDMRHSALVHLGLIELDTRNYGKVAVTLSDPVIRVLREGARDDDGLTEALVGTRCQSNLVLDDYREHATEVDLIRRTLSGALRSGAPGVNILLHGPPGTGKTELAKVLAGAADAHMYSVGETDEWGDEPTRWERVMALKLAQRILAGRRDVVLLFDEMEDMIGEAEMSSRGRYYSKRDGSKIFINRLFETNAVPTIWTSNAIENVDPAILRRMSYVMKLDVPAPAVRKRIIDRITSDENVALPDDAIGRIADLSPESLSVARNIMRTARLACADEAETDKVADALVTGVRHGRRVPPGHSHGHKLDLRLCDSPHDISALFGRLTAPGAPLDFTLLLTGPPGTGKTALAHHLARTLDRPLLIKRASDILSMWVGGTERQIADAFAQAVSEDSVLLLDEIDSLLADRCHAERSWEVSQVNELLTWMDHHPLPFIAATNHADRLDPAAMRRFVFKIALCALPANKVRHAYRIFFKHEPPVCLDTVEGLTPGDFANVARQLQFDGAGMTPGAIVDRLAAEAAAKPGLRGKIGFRRA